MADAANDSPCGSTFSSCVLACFFVVAKVKSELYGDSLGMLLSSGTTTTGAVDSSFCKDPPLSRPCVWRNDCGEAGGELVAEEV